MQTWKRLKEERLSYLRSLQRHPAMEYGEVRSVVALKRGVGDHSPERFADPGAMHWKSVKRLNALT